MNAKTMTMALAVAAAAVVQAVQIPFDEGVGLYADAKGSEAFAELSPTVKWARGSFGTAIATGEKDAVATVQGLPPPVNGKFTLSMRFRKTGKGYGKYPCLLSTTGWDNGGILLFSGGKDVTLRLRSTTGKEFGLMAIPSIPENKWVALSVVFSRPDVTVYVDGKKAKSGKWDFDVPFRTFMIGGWFGSSFGGLIDDFRVEGEALSAAAVAEWANDPSYGEIEGYQDDGTGGVARTQLFPLTANAPIVSTLKCGPATVAIDGLGCIHSIVENATSRELVAEAMSMVVVTGGKDGRKRVVRRVVGRDGGVSLFFQDGRELPVDCAPFDGGCVFTFGKLPYDDYSSVELMRVKPVCGKYRGDIAGIHSDDDSAVCVRSCEDRGALRVGQYQCVSVEAPMKADGLKIAFAAGPRKGFQDQLKAMTAAAGIRQANCGGAWSVGGEASRWGYVFANVGTRNVDYWIDLAKRSGFSIIHFQQSWASSLGSYPVNKDLFPNGIDDMRDAVEKIHAAGLKAGIHTHTGCISVYDPWIATRASELVYDAEYTLSRPFKAGDTELYVDETPVWSHALVYTYSSNGNFLNLGDEIVQYQGIVREKPCRFTGIRRAMFKTKNGGDYAAGTKARYLHQRYIGFYPRPGTKLIDDVADAVARVYNACNLDGLYFDGSEGMGSRYAIDVMRTKIFQRLKDNNGHSPVNEASCGSPNNWWWQTRCGTFDHGVYGVKRFHDVHVSSGVNGVRRNNFLEPQMGWWMPRTDVPCAPGHFLDEMEYFAGKNVGHDLAMSQQGVTARPLPIGVLRQLCVLSWYEWPRLADAFRPEAKEYLAGDKTEARLRQDDDGVWRIRKMEEFCHRAGLEWTREWSFESAFERPAALRVEALYRAKEGEGALTLLKDADFAALKSQSADGVKASFSVADDAKRGKVVKISATNERAPQEGSWAKAWVSFDTPNAYDIGKDRLAFGAWVKGDGSGALLNLQLTTPGVFTGGASDHYFRLDFTGWRYVTFLLRERDAGEHWRYKWPYGGYALVYRNFLSPQHLGTVAAFLNDIPAGRTATVEIASLAAMQQEKTKTDTLAVELNGERIAVPFAMESGEYAELDDGVWTHYSAMGKKMECAPANVSPAVKKGVNKARLDGAARARVTFFAFGPEDAAEAFVELTDEQRRKMSSEAMMPFEYAPAKRLFPPRTIPVRPGEKASLSFEVLGPAENPSFEFSKFFGFSKTVCTANAKIGKDETLVCRDGVRWEVRNAKSGDLVSEGMLTEQMPTISSSTPLKFSASVPDGEIAEVSIRKEYE